MKFSSSAFLIYAISLILPSQAKLHRLREENKEVAIKSQRASHSTGTFIAENPEQFLSGLKEIGVSDDGIEMLNKTAFDCFMTQTMETKVYLPASGGTKVRLLLLQTTQEGNENNKVRVDHAYIDAEADVEAKKVVFYKRDFKHKKSKYWDEEEGRGLDQNDINKLMEVLMNNVVDHARKELPQLSISLPKVLSSPQIVG